MISIQKMVRFFGWVDQRTTESAKVRGEVIRRVKQPWKMPEPVQTIRLERVRAVPVESKATPESRAVSRTLS